jgi:predicted nucleotidyltransferase
VLGTISELEADCLSRYLSLLERQLGQRLLEVRMFGSAARGDMWSASAPMHSDIDLLVVTSDSIGQAEEEVLLNETYALFLECGRQLSPHFHSLQRLQEPEGDRMREFLANIAADVVVVWPN